MASLDIKKPIQVYCYDRHKKPSDRDAVRSVGFYDKRTVVEETKHQQFYVKCRVYASMQKFRDRQKLLVERDKRIMDEERAEKKEERQKTVVLKNPKKNQRQAVQMLDEVNKLEHEARYKKNLTKTSAKAYIPVKYYKPFAREVSGAVQGVLGYSERRKKWFLYNGKSNSLVLLYYATSYDEDEYKIFRSKYSSILVIADSNGDGEVTEKETEKATVQILKNTSLVKKSYSLRSIVGCEEIAPVYTIITHGSLLFLFYSYGTAAWSAGVQTFVFDTARIGLLAQALYNACVYFINRIKSRNSEFEVAEAPMMGDSYTEQALYYLSSSILGATEQVQEQVQEEEVRSLLTVLQNGDLSSFLAFVFDYINIGLSNFLSIVFDGNFGYVAYMTIMVNLVYNGPSVLYKFGTFYQKIVCTIAGGLELSTQYPLQAVKNTFLRKDGNPALLEDYKPWAKAREKMISEGVKILDQSVRVLLRPILATTFFSEVEEEENEEENLNVLYVFLVGENKDSWFIYTYTTKVETISVFRVFQLKKKENGKNTISDVVPREKAGDYCQTIVRGHPISGISWYYYILGSISTVAFLSIFYNAFTAIVQGGFSEAMLKQIIERTWGQFTLFLESLPTSLPTNVTESFIFVARQFNTKREYWVKSFLDSIIARSVAASLPFVANVSPFLVGLYDTLSFLQRVQGKNGLLFVTLLEYFKNDFLKNIIGEKYSEKVSNFVAAVLNYGPCTFAVWYYNIINFGESDKQVFFGFQTE